MGEKRPKVSGSVNANISIRYKTKLNFRVLRYDGGKSVEPTLQELANRSLRW